jgi:serine/threonine protein kinase
MENNYENIFIELCKSNNSNFLELKNIILNNINENNYSKLYTYLYNKFINQNNNIKTNIELIKYFLKYINNESINILVEEINNKNVFFINNKTIYSSLKSLLITCKKNKKNNNIISSNKKSLYILISDKINIILNKLKTIVDTNKIIYYINKISIYLDKSNKNINYNNIILELNNLYINDLIINDNILSDNLINKISKNSTVNDYNYIELILKLINKCKQIGNISINELNSILINIDKNIYNYIYYLNDNIFEEKNNAINFVNKLGYEKKNFDEIDLLSLKRGYIIGITQNNIDYLLKYQPNKSTMELIINCYLKNLNYNNFLIPELFFINNDNSYFYIIKKYNTDLYKYFNILEKNNKILTFNNILNIIYFIIKSINILHNNNIIHSDLKLENIVLNVDENYIFKDLKIIDFDVALFNKIPDYIESISISEKYQKILTNKKPRGTKIYMLKDKLMSFNNDIFSLGVIALVLLYKNIKLILSYNKTIENKKMAKKLTSFRNNIEDNKNKMKMINTIEEYLKKECNSKDLLNNNTINNNFFNNNIDKFKIYKNFINDSINNKLNIKSIIEKYEEILFI